MMSRTYCFIFAIGAGFRIWGEVVFSQEREPLVGQKTREKKETVPYLRLPRRCPSEKRAPALVPALRIIDTLFGYAVQEKAAGDNGDFYGKDYSGALSCPARGS